MNVGLIKLYYSVYGYDIPKIAHLMGLKDTAVRVCIETHGLTQTKEDTAAERLESEISHANLVKDHALLPKYVEAEDSLLTAILAATVSVDPEDPAAAVRLEKLAKAIATLRGGVVRNLNTSDANNMVVQILNSI